MSKKANILYYLLSIKLLSINAGNYTVTAFNDCSGEFEIITQPNCLTASSVDDCSSRIDCYPDAVYFKYDTIQESCNCLAFEANGCDTVVDGEFLNSIYNITAFGECDSLPKWTDNLYFGSFYGGIFAISLFFAVFIFLIFCCIWVKVIKNKRYNEFSAIGTTTQATKFSNFETWVSQNGQDGQTRHWECTVYYEATTNDGLVSVSGDKYSIDASTYESLTQGGRMESHPGIVKEGTSIIYDPQDVKSFVFESELQKSLNKSICSCCVIFGIIIFIGLLPGVFLMSLALSFNMFDDPGNVTTSVVTLLICAIVVPLLGILASKSCWKLGLQCKKKDLTITSINESRLPNLQGSQPKLGLKNKNTEQQLNTVIQMSEPTS